VLSEPYALCRKTVDVGSADLLLAVTSQLRVSQVIGEDEDNVRLPRPCVKGAHRQQKNKEHDPSDLCHLFFSRPTVSALVSK
jgi:hypothetical protein